jgi:type IV secretion system protein VirB9
MKKLKKNFSEICDDVLTKGCKVFCVTGIAVLASAPSFAQSKDPKAPVPAEKAADKTTDKFEQIERRLSVMANESVSGCNVATVPYRTNQKISIYPRAGRTVTLGFQPDEAISVVIWDQMVKGELVEDDYTHPDGRNLTLRMKGLLPVTGLITTTQRRYFVHIIPTQEGLCQQGVVFAGNDSGAGAFNPFGSTATAPTGVLNPSVSEVAAVARPGDDVFSGQPNFNYEVTGEAAFKPVAVYDNGRFTWIQFSNANQSLPAVFYSGPNGLEIVNYTPLNNGLAIVVNRLMDKMVLKIGPQEVLIQAQAKRP